MKKNSLMMAIIAVAVLATAPFATAFQGGGCKRQKVSACPAAGAGMAELSQEETEKMKAAGERYMEETADLRQAVYEKVAALKAELAKKSPDVAAASVLQKEISDIEAQLDQKKLEHIIEMKAIAPNGGRPFMRHHGGPGAGCGNTAG